MSHAKPLSWSELDLFERDPEEHRRRYVEGISTPSTVQQEFGSLIHQTIADPKFNWLKELVVKNRPPEEQRIARKLLNSVESKRPPDSEVFMTAETGNGIPILAVFDGLDRDSRILYEYKTSGSGYWTQKTVDEHGQLSFYALVYFQNFHQYFREIQLHRLHTKSGTVKTFNTARGPADLRGIYHRITICYQKLIDQGLWDRRLSKSEREKRNNQTLF